MTNKTTTLYKGDKKRRVGTAQERHQLLASGWSEKAPRKKAESKPAQKKADDTKPAESAPAPKTDSK